MNLTEDRNVLDAFQAAIIAIYKKESLTCLRGLHNEYELNGRNILAWHSEVITANEIKYKTGKTYYNNISDLLFCSDEVLYFTANLFLYRPYINNPLNDYQIFNGKEIFPNYQNLAGKRYSMFADIVGQKLYNYWDRIGDLIATFFPNKLKPEKIYFSSAINIIPNEFHGSSNYVWLKNFKENEYAKLNMLRKQIVHYYTTDTQYNSEHLELASDREKMEALHAEREALPDFYKQQIQHTIEGFQRTLQMLEEVNSAYFPRSI